VSLNGISKTKGLQQLRFSKPPWSENKEVTVKLKDKICLITGTESKIGIGYRLAREYANEGALVAATDINVPEETVRDIENGGGQAFGLQLDVTKEEDIENAVLQLYEQFGRIDVLVNNAGVCPYVPLLDLSKEVWDITINVNLTGVFLLSLAVVKKMVEKKQQGKIVNIASMCVQHPAVNQTPYAASKAGVYMLTKNMALELADHRINVNALAPGGMGTNILKRGDEILEELGQRDRSAKSGGDEQISDFDAKQNASKDRELYPYDIARAAVFLASEDANHITGETLFVNGFRWIL
jgi:NAD(P)-dependent dehydrogenase (short-subunit alcohol dehydrogenase family)